MYRRWDERELEVWAKKVREIDGRKPGDIFTVIGPMGNPCRYCGQPTEVRWDSDISCSDHCDDCESKFSEWYQRRKEWE